MIVSFPRPLVFASVCQGGSGNVIIVYTEAVAFSGLSKLKHAQ